MRRRGGGGGYILRKGEVILCRQSRWWLFKELDLEIWVQMGSGARLHAFSFFLSFLSFFSFFIYNKLTAGAATGWVHDTRW